MLMSHRVDGQRLNESNHSESIDSVIDLCAAEMIVPSIKPREAIQAFHRMYGPQVSFL
jgi:hypothetical protein